MRFMNDFDIECSVRSHTRDSFPNRLGAAQVIAALADWADTVSDGWAYWPKPARAAAKLMELADGRHDSDCSDAELASAGRPVKAFLTKCARERHGLHPDRALVTPLERELILRGLQPVA